MTRYFLRALVAAILVTGAQAGVALHYQLPTTGPLPRTYLVTLAITDPVRPGWLVCQPVRGQVRTVTAANAGRFEESWDGLDDNDMPVPAGRYGVRGIYAPAGTWRVDGEYHSVTPRFVGGPSCWLPSREQWATPEPFGGDPCGAPLADIDVAPGGTSVFYWQYLENGLNLPMFDLTRPVGLGQFLRAFGSGGAGGGSSVCTDGQSVWAFSTDGGPKYVYRADGQPFGTGRANRLNVLRPEGWVKGMACARDGGASFVYIAQAGRVRELPSPGGQASYVEAETDRVDKVSVQAGADGKLLGDVPLPYPRSVCARGGSLYVLHQGRPGCVVSVLHLVSGLPQSPPTAAIPVPGAKSPADLEVDDAGRLYVSDPDTNHVYQFDRAGRLTHTFGRLAAQAPGRYDRETFITPGKLATWRDAQGQDRLLVVEQDGPNRVTEWSADGRLLREFLPPQTKANDGWTVDPEHPELAYLMGQGGWLTRFRIDYERGPWQIDAVWPKVRELRRPVFIRQGGHAYLACKINSVVYRLDGDRWLLSAGIRPLGDKPSAGYAAWHDANGDGVDQPDELAPLAMPGQLLRYHGNNWLGDLSLIAPNQSGPDVWRLAPERFDAHGNPVFRAWTKVLTDPVFAARRAGTATALFGGNELADSFHSDWAQVDGSPERGYWVNARGGQSFSANDGAQYKISHYEPEGRGGYALRWRTGRAALGRLAQPGEIYGAIHINQPIGGLVSVVDNTRCGVLLYTEDGLYVDTLFPDGRRFPPDKHGVYPQPGEFFAGLVYADTARDRVCVGLGKVSPLLFEAEGWTPKGNPTRRIEQIDAAVTLSADAIASPPEIALAVRGGAGAARLARFAPATGGADMTGSLAGWEACEPIRFAADAEHSVEVRLLYDPDHLYLRWQARLGATFEPKALAPIERLFTHDRLADTLSFYVQGDPQAKPLGAAAGRPGDVRLVFGVCRDGEATRPVALALHAQAPPGTVARPQTYRTPVGQAAFGHVGELTTARLSWQRDADGRGFVLTAAIPRAALPGLPPLGPAVRTTVNFEATFAGHNKFWWSNADGSASRETYDEPSEARLYPGAWAPAQFRGLGGGLVLRQWQVCGPFGGPGAEKLTNDPNGPMPGTDRDWKQATRDFCEAGAYPPDDHVDLGTVFRGPLISGYWGAPGELRWRPATVADLDTRVVCGGGGQVWYGATWLQVPSDCTLQAEFEGHEMTPLRWWLNDQRIQVGTDQPATGAARRTATGTLNLRAGWNEIRFRGYCYGYPPFRAGLVLLGPEDKLWGVRTSAAPPAR